jgi:anti-sigma factor RsiW
VKPWFNGKLDYAPPVSDLSGDGFSLLGGRVDYVGHRRVAALAYQHRQHVINLYVWPASREMGEASKRVTDDGYNLLGWSDRGMRYWAIADVDPAELEALHAALRSR